MRVSSLVVMGVALGIGMVGCAQSEGVGGGAAGFGGFPDGGGVGGTSASGGTGAGGGTGATGGGGTGAIGGGGTGAIGGGGTGATGGGGTGAIGGGGTGAIGGGGSGGSGGCTAPVSGTCDTIPQCGCGSGLECQVTSNSGATQCVAAGSVQPYYACVNENDCTAGYSCVGGACKAFCAVDTDCASTQGTCFQVQYTDTSGNPQPIPQFKVCSKKCALENPAAACGPTLSCYVDNSVTPVRTDCAKAGTATSTGACSSDPTACAPGYACLTTGDCKHWCRVGFSDCGAGQTCSGFGTPLMVGSVEYGVCP